MRHYTNDMPLLHNRLHDDRPWGSFDQFTENEPTTIKVITVAPGKRLSLQKHAHRSEYWRVLAGSGTARVGDTEYPAKINAEFEIPIGTIHRLGAGPEGITVLEIAFGSFDEKDITRLEDDFGRTANP